MSKHVKKCRLVLTFFLLLAFASCNKPTSSIDPNLQVKVESILQLKMSEINAISGQAIVMDMKGNIKAMVGNGQKQPSSLMRTVFLHEALEIGKVHLSDTMIQEGVAIINGDLIFTMLRLYIQSISSI